MLHILRKAAGTWVAKILFVLLILSFAVWGIGGDFFGGGARDAVATVGDSEISQTDYSRALRRETERLRARLGNSITQEMALQLGLGTQVLSSLVEQKLLTLEAHDLGIRISDELVRQKILSEPAFQEGGGFDHNRFLEALRQNGMTEGTFVGLLRDDIVRGLIGGAVTGGVAVPRSLAETLYRFRQEQRTAEILFLPNDKAGSVAEPDEAAIKAYYDANGARYTAPEYRAVTAVMLRPEDIAAKMEISDEQLAQAYAQRAQEFRVPEVRQVSQLLFADEAAARAAAERLRTGASFDQVATDAGGAQRTDLGAVRKGDLFPAQVETAVFALASPGVTEPVQSPLGWHILSVSSITPETTPPLEAVRDRLRQDIARERAAEEIFEMTNDFEDAMAGGATIQDAAAKLGLPVVTIAATDRNGKDAAGNVVPDLPADPIFLTTVFETAEGGVSRLTESRDGSAFALKVDKVTARQQRPLDAVRDQVATAWKAAEARKLATAEAEKIAEAVRAGTSLADAGRARNLTAQTLPAFTRQANLPADHLPAGLVEKLFAASVGRVAVESTPEGAVIAKLVSVTPPEAATAQIDALRTELARGMAADIQAQYSTTLQQRHGVSVNEDALRRAL